MNDNGQQRKMTEQLYEVGQEIIVYTEELFSICSIATEHYLSCEELAKYNGLNYKLKLPPNTKLKVPITLEFEKVIKTIPDIMSKVDVSFKQGLLNVQDSRRPQAGEYFNKSVEIFLVFGVNVSRNEKLQNCYNQLIETIYHIEFPSNAEQPQIRSLSTVCGWNWSDSDYKLADSVAKLILNSPNESVLANGAVNSTMTIAANTPTQGFNEQKFEASPLDELAKLELMSQAQTKVTAKAKILVQPALVGRTASDSQVGPKPTQLKDGKVAVVLAYMNEVLHDPYSMRFVRWSEVNKADYGGIPCWRVQVKYRAKNLMGAYVLSEDVFYIRKNKVIKVIKLD